MAFGFSRPASAQLNGSMMGGDAHIMGTGEKPEKRTITLTPFGYEVNGTGVANGDWHPEAGETVTMIGPDKNGHLTSPMGAYQYMGAPPAASEREDAYGLPGLIQSWVRQVSGSKR